MELSRQKHRTFILCLWTFSCVVFAQREAPTVSLITAPKAAVERSYVHFICKVTGSPKPTVTWYKDTVALTSSHRAYTFTLPDGELLRLGPVRQSRHSGNYQCRASNPQGSATSQKVSLMIFRASSAPSGFPRITKHPFLVKTSTGEDATFNCNATGTPEPSISWMKDKLPLNLSQSSKYTAPSRGVLRITNVQPEDKGSFECVVSSRMGMVYSRAAKLLLEVRYSKPVITSPPQPVTVDPETVVYLNCSATGYPRPSIVWEQDGVRFAGSGNTYGVLIIQDIQRSGNYTCVAASNRGEARASAYVTVRKLPFAPTRPSDIEITADSITITWQPGGGPPVESFTLYYRSKTASNWNVTKGIKGRDSTTLNNLKPFTEYQFRLFAVNDVGISKASPLAEFTTHEKAPGSPPRNIQAKGTSDNSFEATWLPPLEPNGIIRGYRLFYSTDLKKDFKQWQYKTSALNQTDVTGLQRETTYFFRLMSYNDAGKGPLTELFAVKTARGAPGQPEKVEVTVLSPRSIQVTWQPPKYDGNGVYGYAIYCNKSSADKDGHISVSEEVFGEQITNLRPYTYYKVQVAVKSDTHTGPMSFAKVVQTLEDKPSSPPQNIRSKALDSTSLEISWDPPPSDQLNGRITHYTIKYKEKRERPTTVTVNGIKTSIRIHNLKKYTTYFVMVSASTSVGEGPMSPKHPFATAEDVPSGAPRQLQLAVVNSSTIVVRWEAPLQEQQDGRIQGYTVLYQKVDDQGNQLIPPAITDMRHTESEDTLVLSLNDLDPATTYLIQVTAYTVKGDGPRSVPKYARTLAKTPDPPHVYTGRLTSSGVSIRWRTSDTDVVGYKIRYGKSLRRLRERDHHRLKMKEITFLPGTLNHVFKGLDPGLWYLFFVSVQNNAGWSSEKFIWVETQPAPPTGPPLEVRASAQSPTRIRLRWKEPDVWKRNGPLVGYSVVYNPLNRRGLTLVKNVTNPNQTLLILTDLKMFTDYEIRVRAIGIAGPGPLSRPVVVQTKEGVPGPPRDLSANARSTESVTVSWNSPRYPNGMVLSYLVIYSDDKNLPLSQWSSMEAPGYSASIKALSRDTQYWIRVAARTSVGRGNYSLPVSEKTLKYDLPEACRELKADSVGSETVQLNWQPPETDAGITKYKVSYSGSKSYKENGKLKQLSHNREITLDAVSPGSQSYALDSLVPHTTYLFNVSAENSMGEGPSIQLIVKTDKGKPPALKRPTIIEDELSDEFIPMELETASERNGPISYYIVIVVPLGNSNQLPKDMIPDDFFKEVRRRRDLLSDSNGPYIAAKFGASLLPKRFNVGDKNFNNRFGYYNKELKKGIYYTMFTRAYVKNNKGEALFTSSPFATPVKFGVKSDEGGNTGALEDPEAHTGGGLNLIFIIVPLAAVVVITAIIAAVIFVCRRRRRKGNKKSRSTDEEKSEPSDPVELKRMTCQTPAMMDHPPIPVDELFDRINGMKSENNSKFTQEYESIEPGETFTSDASIQEYNKPKNRYPNILAFDHSRVRLATVDGIPGSDYINANFCDGYRKENAYIATQGPLEDTIEDFWRMIWEHRTFTIVMLTDLEERGRTKCEQYWPNEAAELYGDIEVTVTDWVELANYTITTLQVCKEGATHREVKHFQFTGWPDHGVPPHPTPFLAFLRRVRFYNPTDAGPIAVHCSAGVGRTACFIVIDSMLERLKHENTVDIYGHVTVLRTQRNHMVQTQEQYVFIHDAVLEAVTCGNTEVHARNLLHHIKRLSEPGEGGMLGLTEEFRKLSNPNQARRLKQGAGSLPINRSKNRLANILPYESNRVFLVSARGIEGSDYINASFIDGYRQRFAYIATQGPLEDTVDDFWRMLMEQNSNIIVMLTQLHEGNRERCFKYWPSDRSAKYQYYVVDPVSEQEFPTFIVRDFKVKDAVSGKVRNIKQFHFFGWTDGSVTKSGEGILDLIGQVQRTYEQQEEEGPITVHCSDGVGRTGVFCALCIVLERMRAEGVVDLFQTVKLLRTQRPNMIQNQEQYLFCYQKALEYLSSFDHYAV